MRPNGDVHDASSDFKQNIGMIRSASFLVLREKYLQHDTPAITTKCMCSSCPHYMETASYVSQDSNATIQEKTSSACLLQAFTVSLTSTMAQNSETILSWEKEFKNRRSFPKRQSCWILYPHDFAARECLQWWKRVEEKVWNFLVSQHDKICMS